MTGRLFDSTAILDHLEARKVCARCPMVTACLAVALEVSASTPKGPNYAGPDGTWAGLLWVGGDIVPMTRGERAAREAA